MRRVNSAEWDAIVKAREERLRDFTDELRALLEKHNLEIQATDCYISLVRDVVTNEIVGEMRDADAKTVDIDSYSDDLHDYEWAEKVKELNL